MVFDPCDHKIKLIVIQAARLLRVAKGMQEERDITTLLLEVAPLFKEQLGEIISPMTSSLQADHLPAPHEMKMPDGNFAVPRRDCPKCARRESVILYEICSKCEDSEGGMYFTMWHCGKMTLDRKLIEGTGCGHKEKSKRHYVSWLDELKVEYKSGTKESLGIKTITDNGLK